jgi:hypothetical protein
MAAGFLNTNQYALPGVGTELVSTVRELLCTEPQAGDFLPFPATIDGTLTRDPDNPTTTRTDVLRDGLPMGQVTSTLKYANAIIGQLQAAITGTTTNLLLTVTEAAEIVRRIGATGTFNITGPASAGGAVRTVLATYSAVGAGSGANAVQTFAWLSVPTAGSFTLTLTDKSGNIVTTAAIAYNATVAGSGAGSVAASVNAVLGTSAVTATASASTTADNGFYLTFSGTGYAALPQPSSNSIDDTLITYTTTTGWTETQTTIGVPVAGSVTITALGVNEVQTVAFPGLTAGTLSAGTFRFRLLDKNGVWQSFGEYAAATAITTVQTDLDLALGASAVVISATVSTTLAGGFFLTFSGTGYAGVAQTALIVLDGTGTALVSGSTRTVATVTRTTAGVGGAFVAGSWIQPTDGSQNIKTLLRSPTKQGVWDLNALLQSIDIIYPEVLLRGFIRTAYIIDYPGDGSTFNAYMKAQLRANSGGYWQFDDDFVSVS